MTIEDWRAEEEFTELLSELYGPVTVAGLLFDAGEIIKNLDPIAFREMMLDHYDAEGIEVI